MFGSFLSRAWHLVLLSGLSVFAQVACAQPVDVTPKSGMLAPTPYYGAGSLGAISVAPLGGGAAVPYAASFDDDLYARTGVGQGLHGSAFPALPSATPVTPMLPPALSPTTAFMPTPLTPNVQGFDAPARMPMLSAAAPSTHQDKNFTFVAPNTAQHFDGFFSRPQGNVQGYDSTLAGSFYGGLARRDFFGARSPSTRRADIDQTLNPSPKPALPRNTHAEAIQWNPAALYGAQP